MTASRRRKRARPFHPLVQRHKNKKGVVVPAGLSLALVGCWIILVFRAHLNVVPPKQEDGGGRINGRKMYNDQPVLPTKKVLPFEKKNNHQDTTTPHRVLSHHRQSAASASTSRDSPTPPAFEEDVVCRGCRHAVADDENDDPEKGERCGVYIQRELEGLLLLQHHQQQRSEHVNNLNTTTKQLLERRAAATVAQRYKGCQACRPPPALDDDAVRPCDNRFWRYDAAAPPVADLVERETWLTAASLPSRHRLSAAATRNVTSYFMNSPQHVYPAAEYFMEYNPSLVVLPPRQAQSLLLGGLRRSSNSSSNQYDDHYYVASFRVSNQHYCFRPADRRRMAGGGSSSTTARKSKQQVAVGRDYLGLAVLNGKFEVVLDTVVDLKQAAAGRFAGAQDFRLFVLPTSSVNNNNNNNNDDGSALLHQLYITSNDLIAPIQLTLSDVHTENKDAAFFEKENYQLVPRAFDSDSDNNNNNQHQKQLRVWVRAYPSCAPCGRKRGFCGKNFNYFVDDDSNNNNNKVMVEIWPTGPHTVRAVDLNEPCRRGRLTAETFVDGSTNHHDAVLPARATVEEVDIPVLRRRESILTRGRGGACCVRYNSNGSNRTLLLGIQHSKTPSQHNRQLPGNLTSNHYLSSFYAFEPVQPYRVVAQSAWFCLGFPPPNATSSSSSLAKATSWRKLTMGGGKVYACPRIHFVSGMTLAPDDPSTVLVAYGINDCVSRFVRIRLSDVFFGDDLDLN